MPSPPTIEQILPDASVAVEAREDDLAATLLPAEEECVGRAVEKRRREFVTGRACARRALEQLGFPQMAVPCGSRGEPRWPVGVVGSITHCAGYRACAVAKTAEIISLGIDAEVHEPLPPGLLGDVARAEERRHLSELSTELPAIHWDRLLFSAKESVYKAWFPLAERWLGFEDASLTFNPKRGEFSAQLLVSGPVVNGSELTRFSGRWMVLEGLAISAVAISAETIAD